MARASAAGIKKMTAEAREAIAETILPRAGRIIAKVIAEEARSQCTSDAVRETIKTRVETIDGIIRVSVETRGRAAFQAPWLEYGTDPHEIGAAGQALKIGDRFVTGPLLHPGARAVPFLRPAFDLKQGEGFAKAQAYVDQAVPKLGIGDTGEGDE